MKFGKSLSNQIEETLPEWRDKFLSYKDLKKRLKLINPKHGGDFQGNDCDRPIKRRRILTVDDDHKMSAEEVDFIQLLEDELEKFNSFFVEKEEEYIIGLKELQDRLAKTKHTKYEEMLKIRKEIVDFHGEMVLLENYSALNYTGSRAVPVWSLKATLSIYLPNLAEVKNGLVKILKKYDKRTGALIRLPFIQRVLQQPFFTTDLLYKLVKECERMLDLLFPIDEPITTPSVDENESCNNPTTNNGLLRCAKVLAEIEQVESLYMKSTISALRALKQIRSGSSTVSMFSLPPLQLNGLEDTWKKIPVLEQVAK